MLPRLQHLALGLFGLAFVLYVLLCILLYTGQDALLYHPTRVTLAAASARGVLLEDRALVLEPPREPRGTVLIFHGNAGSALDRLGYGSVLGELGLRVVLAEYPGYGWRPGLPDEPTLVADGVSLLARVRARYPEEPLLVLGESLGAGVAARVVGQSPVQPDRLILITPFDSLRAVGEDRLPFVPVRWLLRAPFDAAAALRDYRHPIALALAGQDEVVGLAAGQRLAASLDQHPGPRGPATVVALAAAGHNSLFYQLREQDWRLLLGLR